MLYLTLDIDWAHDALIEDAVQLIEAHQFKATWFATHATPLLDEIRKLGGHELGLHPNFNPLLEGKGGHPRDVLQELQEIIPEAVTVRSHSLVRSSRLSLLFAELGLTHESNIFISPAAGADMHPWRDFSSLVQVPIRWEDDVRLLDWAIGEAADHVATFQTYVVDFHPIHVFLNTATHEDYVSAQCDARFPDKLLARRRPEGSGGSRDRLIKLMVSAREQAVKWGRLAEITPNTGSVR